MPEEIKAEATIQVPSSIDLPEAQPIPQAETVLAAAVETGKAQQAAETAAEEAKESASKMEPILARMTELEERLATLEAEETEEAEEPETLTIPEEEDGTLAVASAQTVTLDEPQSPKGEIQTKQSEMPQEKRGSGGLFKKMFLNQ
jgi:hypothetical protein